MEKTEELKKLIEIICNLQAFKEMAEYLEIDTEALEAQGLKELNKPENGGSN